MALVWPIRDGMRSVGEELRGYRLEVTVFVYSKGTWQFHERTI